VEWQQKCLNLNDEGDAIMNIKPYGKVTGEAIKEFEKLIKFSLPQDYQQFLMEYNGGSALGIFHVNTLHEDIFLHVLFGLMRNEELDLKSWFLEYKDDLMPYTVIVGGDMGAGLIVLLNSPQKQGVYYWDHSYYFNKSSDNRNIYKIANSFQEFIYNLKAPETE
jgi:hypothetical protein